jgi:ferredoxin
LIICHLASHGILSCRYFVEKFKVSNMETTLFYFSATGNSLSLTRNLSNELGDCEIVSIAKAVNNETIKITTTRIGIVFPVFAWGMPRIVEEFVSKLSFSSKPYIFAIATCVAIQGNTLKDLKKALRLKGADLNAGFAVKAGRSSLMQLNSLDNIIIRLDRHRLRIKDADNRMPEMLAKIEKLVKHKPETSSWAANIFGSMFHGLAVKTFKNIDSTFVVEDSCKACGNCANLCPRSNIVIENGRPTFLHSCEFCHACIQWCPNFAIKHPNFDNTLKQYRNPTVKMNDMIISM